MKGFCNPARNYTPGDLLILADGRTARLAQIIPGHNPVQGDFQILTFADADLPRLVAGLAKSSPDSTPPTEDNSITKTENEAQAREILNSEAGLHLRGIVQQALQNDKRCVDFAGEWWLLEKLPYTITTDEIASIRRLLQEQTDGGPRDLSPLPADELAELLWNVSPKDVTQMRLATFSLNCALFRQSDFRYLRVGGWIC